MKKSHCPEIIFFALVTLCAGLLSGGFWTAAVYEPDCPSGFLWYAMCYSLLTLVTLVATILSIVDRR